MNPPSPKKAIVAVILTALLVNTLLSIYPRIAVARGAVASNSHPTPPERAANLDPEVRDRIDKAYGILPLSFVANRGQNDSRVQFTARGAGYDLFLTESDACLVVSKPLSSNSPNTDDPSLGTPLPQIGRARRAAIRMTMVGRRPASHPVGLDPPTGVSSYFRGKDSAKWVAGAPTYAKIRYPEVYPGISLTYYGTNHEVEYDFDIAAGSDPRSIRMKFEGARSIRVSRNGDLVLRTAAGELMLRKPAAYQDGETGKEPVEARFAVTTTNIVRINVGRYDKKRMLIIDPVFSYSTFLGGTSVDEGRSIALDSSGNAYIAGRTASFNFPTSIDGFDTTYANSFDVFVTKLNSTGTALVYSTFLGGNLQDESNGIAVDSSGNAYVTGTTNSPDYPTTSGAFQTTYGGASQFPGDAFATKLNSNGTALIYSTYLGGSLSEQGLGIAVDASGNAFISGSANSANFPTTPGCFQPAGPGTPLPTSDAFITKINDTGSGLVYSTMLGGDGVDQANGIQLDSAGNAYVTGSTTSAVFPTTGGAFQTSFSGLNDAFVTKMNTTGSGLVYSTYLGGNRDEEARAIALNSSGEAFVTGFTRSLNFPTTPGALKISDGGVTKSTDSGTTWTKASTGLTDATIQVLAIDPSNSQVLYAGTDNAGVFKSGDGGNNWTPSNSGLTDQVIRSLAIDPVAPSTVYLGTNTRGVFRSTDSGATWQGINTGIGSSLVFSLAVDPTNHLVIYAGTGNGVFKTTNGGALWVSSNLPGSIIATAVDPASPSNVYAINSFSGFYRSTDSGSTWTNSLQGSLIRIAVDPSNPSTVYCSTNNGVTKSTDSGLTFKGVNTGLSNTAVSSIAVTSGSVYAGTANGVFRSTNGGSLWSPANAGGVGATIGALAIDPMSPATVYSGAIDSDRDAFVTKVSADGTALGYSTLLGGNGVDIGFGIGLDGGGTACLTGQTTAPSSNVVAPNFPRTVGSFGPTNFFDTDPFYSKVVPGGTSLAYSTTFGGTTTDQGFALAVDSSGSATIAGGTGSANYPVTPGVFQPALNGFNTDAFVTRFAAAPTLTSDLRISLSALPGPAPAGTMINYTVTVTNDGPETASTVVVRDDLPSSVTFGGCFSSTATCRSAGNMATFTLNSLDPGASASITFGAAVSCSSPLVDTVINSVSVDSFSFDPNTANNSATLSVTTTNGPTTLSPTSQTFLAAGGNGIFQVNRNASCPWTPVASAAWITIFSSSSFGNGIVFYEVAANSGGPRSGTISVAGQTFTVNQGGTSPVFQGFLDAAGCGIITGWAWDATQPNAAINIDILDGTFLVATIQANLYREDIRNAGIGDGFHGFSFTTPSFLKSGTPRTIRARYTGTMSELSGSPRILNCTGTPEVFQGFHDGAGCNTISGWAWNASDPNNPINVDIYDGISLIATVPAIQFRPDLVTAGIGNGFHGFSFTVPASLKNGSPHSIRARFPGTTTDLQRTPRTITCSGAAPIYEGIFEAADCNTISGWAWDQNDPNSPINVAIFDGNQLIATVLAIQFRQSLADQGIGNGFHVFVFNTPASLKNGQPHTIRVRFSGSSAELTSSPRTITCSP